VFRGSSYYLKRDDLIDPYLSGNKYRKLFALTQLPDEAVDTLVSYGGNQSNAMLSIAALCQKKGWKFDYYTKEIPAYLKANPLGNLAVSLSLGMRVHPLEHHNYEQKILELSHTPLPIRKLLVRQGGADPLAEQGIKILADEILAWSEEMKIEKLNVVTPSGTGTTAYYLAKSLPNVTVLTTPLIATEAYLLEQMSILGEIPKNLTILQTQATYRFGHLYKSFLKVYREFEVTGIEFDLLYAPKLWLALDENRANISGEILYVHSGGISGNETMLERYAYKGISL